MTPLDVLIDLLDHGCDGEPRWMALGAPDAHGAAALGRLVAREAERRGYVAIGARRFAALRASLPDAMRDRTFALVQTCAAGEPPATSTLLSAAALNARPHVLVTIASAARVAGRPAVLREARTAYAPGSTHAHATSLDGQKFALRAGQGWNLARSGRHQPAVRMIREAYAALVRRREHAAAARAGLLLGRVLLERGRAADAERVFADAAAAVATACPGESLMLRIWMALARTDAGRLTDAESIIRAARMAGPWPDAVERHWADAALARCLLWQRRAREAAQLLEETGDLDADAEPTVATWILATCAGVLLAAGRTFEAGQRARAALERASGAADPMFSLIAETAHLRVLAAVGDVELVGERAVALLRRARALHAPLRALRVRLIWARMLRRAGRIRDAEREVRRCDRLARAAPALLRRAIAECREGKPLPAPPGIEAGHAAFALRALQDLQDEEDDARAAAGLLDGVVAQVRAARVDLQSASSGVLSTIASSGSGLAPGLGARAFDAGIVIGPEDAGGATEAAAPVRSGGRMLGVLACRWPSGRVAPPDSGDLLELAATVLGPRMEALVATRADAARAAVEIPELIGASHAIGELRAAVARAARAPFTVLLEGESGVGKELVARAIHCLSVRRDRRFCDVNCAALPDDLVESELFGHAKGAFTGALVERPGLFEEASGGTLFLDELPDLSLRAQAKLLRVLQQGEIRRVGETFTRRVDVRLVTATNRSMAQEAAAGRFRQDLLYRLDVIRIRIPPLRERPEDVPLLARCFWRQAAERAGTRAALSHAVLAELSRYHWPGNVRELQNVIAALAVAAPARGLVRAALLPAALTGAAAAVPARLVDARREFERRYVEMALARAGGSRTRAARQLGISRQGLLKLIARLGVAAEARRAAE